LSGLGLTKTTRKNRMIGLILYWTIVWVSMIGITTVQATTTTTTTISSMSLEACRTAGFDPYQLACSTCDLLPMTTPLQEEQQTQCKSCCLSYKTLEKTSRRYGAAVILYAHKDYEASGSSFFSDLNSLIKEDWTDLVQLKGKNHVILKDISSMQMSEYYHRPTLLWLDDDTNNKDKKKVATLNSDLESMTVHELIKIASDRVDLMGWKRDDIREMIKAIVPDP